MSKLTQIESRLRSIDSGSFQKLCDAYLYYKYNIVARSEGGVKGKNKTKSGTPDSFILLPNGDFIFNEYTTQVSRIQEKFEEDLMNKCFNPEKTGIPNSKIKKIFLGYNSQMDAKSMNSLRKLCSMKNSSIEFLDIEALKYGLYDYPKLAKDFLQIESDTEQILKYDDFLSEIERKSTSQRESFIGRENELSELVYSFDQTNIILLRGKAGIGKTRLALEAIKKYISKNPTYEALYITNKGVSLYHDIKDYFISGRKYIVLIDDANRLGDIRTLLRLSISDNYTCKIILTVRSYAEGKLQRILKEQRLESSIFSIHQIDDKSIREVLTSINITNSLCVENITKIADGNPRLALMAGDLVIQNNDCNRLRNVVDIYDQYFSNQLHELSSSNEDYIKTLGIICFFRTLDRNRTNLLNRIYRDFQIDEGLFWDNVHTIHQKELIDVYENRALKISDQVMANYFFYQIYIKEKHISLELLLFNYFNEYSGRIKESLYPILEHFGFDEIVEKIAPSLKNFFDSVKDNNETFYSFYKVFPFFKPEKLLINIKLQIDALPKSDNKDYVLNTSEQNSISDNIFELLTLFGQNINEHFPTSLELLFNYVKKRPNLLPQLIIYLNSDVSFDDRDHIYAYWKQLHLFQFLIKKTKYDEDKHFFKIVFLEIAPAYLKTTYEHTKSGRKRPSINIYSITLIISDEIKEIRSLILNNLINLFKEYPIKVVEIVNSYIYNLKTKSDSKLYQHDSTLIIPFLKAELNTENLSDCILVHNYLGDLKKLGINYDAEIYDRFSSDDFKLFKDLTKDYLLWHRDNPDRSPNDFNEYNILRLREKFKDFNFENYKFLYTKLIEFNVVCDDRQAFLIRQSLELLHMNLLESSKDNALRFLEYVVSTGNKIGYFSRHALFRLLQENPFL